MNIYNPEKHITVVEIPKSEIEKIDFALCKQPQCSPDNWREITDAEYDEIVAVQEADVEKPLGGA